MAFYKANSYIAPITKAWLFKIYVDQSSACDRCQQFPANLIHMLWCCPSLINHWTDIFITLSVILEDIDPNAFLLCLGSLLYSFPSQTLKGHLRFTNLLARRIILINWKSPTPHSNTRWSKYIFINLEKILLTLKGVCQLIWKVMGPFLSVYRRCLIFSQPRVWHFVSWRWG